MGNVFSKKPLKEVMRENKRLITKAIRELDREKRNLEKAEETLKRDIKKYAKEGQMNAVKTMAKDLVRNRVYVTKFIEMKSHLQGVSLKLEQIKSHEAMSSAMKSTTKAMARMNKEIKLPELQKIMAEFAKENERAEMTGEMMGDAIDDALSEPGNEEEEEKVVGQILAELNIDFQEKLEVAPSGVPSQGQQVSNQEDQSMSELQARLDNLKR